MTGWLARQSRSHRYFQLLFFAGCVLLAYLVLQRLSGVLAPLLAAAAIAYWLDPAVDWLERRGLGRTPAILVLLLVFLILSTGVVLILVPLIVREIHQLGEKLPGYLSRAHGDLLPWLERTFHTTVPRTVGELLDRAGADAQDLAKGAVSSIQTVVGGTFKSVFALLRLIINLVLVPVFAFYLLRDFDRLVERARRLVPPRRRPAIEGVVGDINRVLSAWFRGQLSVMVIDGALYMIALSVLGVPMGVAIGALAGLLAFVPVVGVLTGLGLALLATFLEFQGWGQVIGVIGVFAAVPAIEMTVVVPRVVGGRVGLGPVAVIVALLLGGELLGFIGILLAVPAAAVINVLLHRLRQAYEGSVFFTRDAQPAAPPAAGSPLAVSEEEEDDDSKRESGAGQGG